MKGFACLLLIALGCVLLAAVVAVAGPVDHAVSGNLVTGMNMPYSQEYQGYIPDYLLDLIRLRELFSKDYHRLHQAVAQVVGTDKPARAEDPQDTLTPSYDALARLYGSTERRAYLNLAKGFEDRFTAALSRAEAALPLRLDERSLNDLQASIARAFSTDELTTRLRLSDQALAKVAFNFTEEVKVGMTPAEAKQAMSTRELSSFTDRSGEVRAVVVFDRKTGDIHAVFDVPSTGKPGWGQVIETIAFSWRVDPLKGKYIDESAQPLILISKAPR
jgi:hypothetical protein